IRMNLRDLLGTRLELRLGDPTESEVDRKVAANVPEKSPGRGLTRHKLHFLTALSRIDGKRTVEDLANASAAFAEQVRAAWPGRPAPKGGLLPRQLSLAEVTRRVGPSARGLPIGLNEAQLAPVLLDFASDPHLIVFG